MSREVKRTGCVGDGAEVQEGGEAALGLPDALGGGGEPCLRRCLEGQASTLLVCGQTGSGKSHSVVGHTEGMGNTIGHDTEEGVLPRLFEALFKLVDDNLDDKCVFEVEFGWVELRGELCYDLLAYAPKRPSDRPVRSQPSSSTTSTPIRSSM